MTVDEFRLAYPQFGDEVDYPPDVVGQFLQLAQDNLRAELWQNMLTLGTGLYVAHFLTLNSRNLTGGGKPQGLGTSKTVGPASVTTDYTMVASPKGGHWNLTSYGITFKYYADLVGSCAQSQYYG